MEQLMFYTLAALVVIGAVVVAGRRSDARGRRRVWIGALVLTGLGVLALLGALLGAWGLLYVAATMLLVGLPVAILFTAWVYLDMRYSWFDVSRPGPPPHLK